MRSLVLAFVLIAASVLNSHAQHHPLVGTWRSSAITQAGEQQVEIVIQANGTYSQQWRGRNVLNTYTGRWQVLDGGLVRFDINDWQPKEWCGPLGCTKILRPPGTTARIQFQGANRFTSDAHGWEREFSLSTGGLDGIGLRWGGIVRSGRIEVRSRFIVLAGDPPSISSELRCDG